MEVKTDHRPQVHGVFLFFLFNLGLFQLEKGGLAVQDAPVARGVEHGDIQRLFKVVAHGDRGAAHPVKFDERFAHHHLTDVKKALPDRLAHANHGERFGGRFDDGYLMAVTDAFCQRRDSPGVGFGQNFKESFFSPWLFLI